MIPPLIVRAALARGIGVLAITDHNASANVAAVQAAAQGTGLVVLPGMELQTREDVHLLCLFDTLGQMAQWQAQVDAALPDTPNNADFFGEQFVVDAAGEFVRREPRRLLTAADIALAEAVRAVQALGGLALPAHVDRVAFGLLPTLGFVPPDVPFAALEISRHLTLAQAREKFPQLHQYPLLQNGDAHVLQDLLGVTEFNLAAPTIAEVMLALQGVGGRSVKVPCELEQILPMPI
jgi:hypothetical protein